MTWIVVAMVVVLAVALAVLAVFSEAGTDGPAGKGPGRRREPDEGGLGDLLDP